VSANVEKPGKKGKRSPLVQRYLRYRAIIEPAFETPVFAINGLRQQCDGESPRFITKVVNELVREGWLVHENSDHESLYRWNKGRGEFSINRWLDEKIYGTQLKLQPAGQRPRERMLAHGAKALPLSELLAILIRVGIPGESAVMAGEKIARHFSDKLDQLADAGRAELKSISNAIHTSAWCQIMAGIELGRRIADPSGQTPAPRLGSTAEAIAWCQVRFSRLISDARQEEFHIVTLDTKNRIIDTHCITVGTLDASLVHPREVFRAAIRDAAKSIILVHNHPSGDATPSREDFRVTERLEEVGTTIGIQVLDHIVLGHPECVSIRERR
jgi:DNA repair protein RadC